MASELQTELKQSKPFASSEEELILNLKRTASLLEHESAMFFKKHDLSSSQYNILRITTGAGKQGLTCSEIRARMVTRVPDVTRLIDRLIDKGLVTRHSDSHDRRLVLIRITPEGKKLAEELSPQLIAMSRSLAGHMSPADQKELSRLLVALRKRPDKT